MKNLLSFLSYHNAVPAALVIVALGAGGAFAASTGMIPLPDMAVPESLPAQPAFEPVEVDVSALLSANLDAFDFRPTVTGVVESDSVYVVSYSVSTLAPENGAWGQYEKMGEFSVGADALGEGGLNAYVVGKLRDIEARERAYLASAQTAEKVIAQKRNATPASAFAGLVGLALDQIFVPVIEKPAPILEPQPSSTAQIATENVATSENTPPVTATTTAEQLAADEQSDTQATSTDSVSESQTETTATTTEKVIPDTSADVAESDQGAASSTEQAASSASEQATGSATTTLAN